MPYTYACDLCLHTEYSCRPDLEKRIGIDPEKFRIVRCCRCSLLSLYPIPSIEDFEWIYADYVTRNDRTTIEKQRMKKIYPGKIRKFLDYATGTLKLLDIGAGVGGFCRLAQDEGIEVVGIEPSTEQVAFAKELFGVELINTTFEQYHSEMSGVFNAVHLHHVIEHLRHPLLVLKQIFSFLALGGVLICEVPNQFFIFPYELFVRMKLIHPPLANNKYHHVHFYSPDLFSALIQKAGFRLMEVNTQIPNPRFVARVKNFIGRKFALPISSFIEIVAVKDLSAMINRNKSYFI